MHLLVVDDEPRLLSLLERGLRAQGFEVQAAAGADEALSMARADPPTLAVLDVMMPGADGFELLEALRGVVPGVPVIMLTARSELEDRIHGLELGAVDYVVKPFSFRELTARYAPRSAARWTRRGRSWRLAAPGWTSTGGSWSLPWACSRWPAASSRCWPT